MEPLHERVVPSSLLRLLPLSSHARRRERGAIMSISGRGSVTLRIGAQTPAGASLILRRVDGEIVFRAHVPVSRAMHIEGLPLLRAQDGWSLAVHAPAFRLDAYLAIDDRGHAIAELP